MKVVTREVRISPAASPSEAPTSGNLTKTTPRIERGTPAEPEISEISCSDRTSTDSQAQLLRMSGKNSESKISSSGVKVAFSNPPKVSPPTAESHRPLGFLSACKRCCLPFKAEFPSRNLELIYERYYSSQKESRILYIIFLDFIVNLVLLTMYGVFLDESNSTQINRLVVTCVFAVLNLTLGVLYFFKLFPRRVVSLLPYIVWFSVCCQLTVDLAVGYDPLVPSDSVGMFLFLMFITYVMLPARLPVCAAFAVVAALVHSVVVGILTREKNFAHLEKQLAANLLLFLCSNLLGAIDYYIADRKQRRSVLETRQSLEVKLSLEAQNLQQRRLLLSVLPEHLATEIETAIVSDGTISKDGDFNKLWIRRYKACSILFADIVGFTNLSSKCTAEELIVTLNKLFGVFDKIATKNRCQRIKILGDCYYCISGLDDNPKHAQCAVNMGLDMITHIAKVRKETGVSSLDMRVGIHSGTLLAGVLGRRKWQFDAWSNDVTLANNMESGGIPGRVHISQSTRDCVSDDFDVEPGDGGSRNEYIRDEGVATYLIVNPGNQRSGCPVQGGTDSNRLKKPTPAGCRRSSSPIADMIAESTLWRRKAKAKSKPRDNPSNRTLDTILCEVLDERTEGVKVKMNPFTLRFHDREIEYEYTLEEQDMNFESLMCLFVVFISCFLVELSILPRAETNYWTFSLGLVLLLLPLIFTAATKSSHLLPSCLVALSRSLEAVKPARTLVATIAAAVLAGTELIDMVSCENPWHETSQIRRRSNLSIPLDPRSPHCEYPQYFSYKGILVLVATSVLVQLSHALKVTFNLLLLIIYCVFNIHNTAFMYDNFDTYVYLGRTSESFVPKKYFSSTIMALCYLILVLHGRQVEKTARMLFLWKMEANEKRKEVDQLRVRNLRLVHNILPVHVAEYFLRHQYKDDTDLYSQSYHSVSVMFASIPNFSEFYSEDGINNEGMECIRFLNEVVNDFDEVLQEPRFHGVEKIKTIGSTYMAACGLKPGGEESKDCHHLVDLVDFALMLRERLELINQESFNNFVLRVGISQGPVVAGVIGAKKPHYDIWGNTVNVASRMESTGKGGQIQVTDQTYELLKDKGFMFTYRGPVRVKGKGQLITYYITGRENKQPSPPTHLPNAINL